VDILFTTGIKMRFGRSNPK